MATKRCDVGSLSDNPCGDLAMYEVARWGIGRDLSLCSHHACDALDDGAEVTGPLGLPCRYGEDGEIFEAQE